MLYGKNRELKLYGIEFLILLNGFNPDYAKGIYLIANAEALKVHFNPNAGSFIIELPGTGTTTISVTDLSGKELINKTINNPTDNKAVFDLENIASGAYFVRVNIGDKIYREKIIIVK